jgi:CheY-like chemotaxis protein
MEDGMARILVVDDEPDSVDLLVEYLTIKGHTAITAANGAEALRRLKEDRPHLILLDILMPGMDGLEVLQQARAIDSQVGIIVVTAVHEEALGREALTLGAFDFITKPIDFIYLDRCLLHKIALMTL